MVLLACALVCAPAPHAQKPAEEPTSTVSGRVFCSDTNVPARRATVMLEPVDVAEALKSGPEPHYSFRGERVQTALDGSFSIHRVDPGTYYVVASQPGYLSPLAALYDPPPEPTPAQPEGTRKPAAISAPRITVQAGLPVSVNINLERGASVSGTVLFDDGSPASGLTVTVLTREKNTWSQSTEPQPFGGIHGLSTTDDQGNYRIAGLQPRKYLVQVMLDRSAVSFQFNEHGGSSSSSSSGDFLAFYSGGKSRRSDAVPFSLSAGEDRHGEDLQIPLSKLHTIRGSILAAHDGHVLNAASVGLLYADDKSPLSSTSLSRDDQDFSFSYVPEGDYILQVDGAADIDYLETPSSSHPSSPPQAEDRILRKYGSAGQPIHVTSDITGIVISVPETAEKPGVKP
jgi:hypothetical protein